MRTRGKDKNVSDSSRGDRDEGPRKDAAIESSAVSGAFALLAEMTQDFADSMDLEGTLSRGLSLIVAHLDSEAGSLWLVDSETGGVTCEASVGPDPITGMKLGPGEGIVGRSISENRCQRVFDVASDPSFAQKVDEQLGFVTRSLLCAPMSIGDKPIGAIEVVNKRSADGRFSESDMHPLQVMASSAALAIANARMTASLVDAERVRREIELAAEIQRNLLPAPKSAPFPIYGANVPARTVSGDFFDFLELPDGRIAFCLGDVSGKGINAALLMAQSASLYRCLAKSIDSPGRLLGVLNGEICETITRGMFVTMVAAVYDPRTGNVRIANAGHEPPLCHHVSGEFASVEAGAPPLGIAPDIVPDSIFPEQEIRLDGGSLYIFSDGLTEATSESGDQLGPDGLKQFIQRFSSKSVAERVEAIMTDVGRLVLRDDLTLLALCDSRARD